MGYATFVLRPKHLGEHRSPIVMPTQTWQAYNFRDDNGDGVPDTWYAAGVTAPARAAVPQPRRAAALQVLRPPVPAWLDPTRRQCRLPLDADLNGASGAELRQAVPAAVFAGHHEYVTQHEYDAVTDFRDRGGNLIFLSANNFFWKITISTAT